MATDDKGEIHDENYPEPIELTNQDTIRDVEYGVAYKGRVNNVHDDYGVFVDLKNSADQISGLVHVSNLPPFTSLADYSVNDVIIVELEEIKQNGDIAFNGLHAPEVAPDAPPESITNVDQRSPFATSAEVEELTKKIAQLEKQLQNIGEQNTNSLEMVNGTAQNAIKTIQSLNTEGFETDKYTQRVVNGGNKVEINLTLVKPDKQ